MKLWPSGSQPFKLKLSHWSKRKVYTPFGITKRPFSVFLQPVTLKSIFFFRWIGNYLDVHHQWTKPLGSLNSKNTKRAQNSNTKIATFPWQNSNSFGGWSMDIACGVVLLAAFSTYPQVHIVWIFGILAFSTNFCPIKTDLSGNTVWLQASDFQKLVKMDHFWHF